ncbi:MAG: hypothetical protein A3D96_00585 [Chlamydiae bacterium RIFCSPHIGHO2_12_FULL_44_59]|nr:MAG: hypothetical protein A2796_00030 [Chlamydiae bacterium RIFCSPHIGHO2_01_FULL_44_39]OGN59943.1 MAG: hypothetical protein A3D96_00585 [Chlamydiae bacterium RIFCSPHIGHO2_12_FULL_44_59]OGN66158.1 MAG: hypothetical protein A2978_05910 [Chlamydiae bacterium RIFCSPLOWO2_01_FULL_44_52]OGN69062.1 MAG: hypothetical protein A3I67_07395 [Chlamydiae bacterium RIFCSPLOWO2_02_FULL_45_22]OGN69915.1 MAG: hypothetical protein A3F79_04615 [Chlamydiae bacterium RIFCSPLOWO2_12_FULL_45_20]
MKRFDCLSSHLPLFGPHLLEASAGTGKTFSMEHIFVRLILESCELESILAVTFTRAAARELKMRIRGNVEKAAAFLREKHPAWDYLTLYFGSEQPLRFLEEALANFDQCQIFTIHGFCYRMLQEFAFEAQVGWPSEREEVPESLRWAALDFIENGIDGHLICPEQFSLLMKQFDSKEEIIQRLLLREEPLPNRTFFELFATCKAALHSQQPIEEANLLQDFETLSGHYKKMKGNFRAQVRALASLHNPHSFAYLLKEGGTLFDFLSSENLKVKRKESGPLFYPGFFAWARATVGPLLKAPVWPILQAAWNPIAEKVAASEDYLDPDGVLRRMKEALGRPCFKHFVQKKYQAVLIDEFQDTDALQWDIFQSLFLEVKTLYFVGDPKQSIYRFRKADVYTYLKAKDVVGRENLYYLDTNFRSSKELISALNALFSRDFLYLPKIQQCLPFQPVKAGALVDSDCNDGKGAIHFFVIAKDSSAVFEEVYLPLAAREMEANGWKGTAILVKDRYQIEKTLSFLKKRGIPAVSKSHRPLWKSSSFQAVLELFLATFTPEDSSLVKMAIAGPFYRPGLSFIDLKCLLLEEGLVAFAKQFAFDADAMQVFEHLFHWEKREGLSLEGIKRALYDMKEKDGPMSRMEVDGEAVQVMTMHIAKGLEFDVVFALGLATRTPSSHEIQELDAEKQRQLYVTLTRAKKRLYIPIAESHRSAAPGTHSPIELFAKHFEGSMWEALTILAAQESITIEPVVDNIVLDTPRFLLQKERVKDKLLIPPSYTPFYLSSFTTLAKPLPSVLKSLSEETDVISLQTMPKGKETGILIHALLEAMFSAKEPLWRDSQWIKRLIIEDLKGSLLEPWHSVIHEMIVSVLSLEIEPGFCLQDLEPCNVQAEMEFVFSHQRDFVKGFIDLVFFHRGQVYFLDWKTNWLENYTYQEMEQAIREHDYELQAAIYREALLRHFTLPFGGALYFFLRGKSFYLLRNFKAFSTLIPNVI